MRTEAQKTHVVIRRGCRVPVGNGRTYMIPSAIAKVMEEEKRSWFVVNNIQVSCWSKQNGVRDISRPYSVQFNIVGSDIMNRVMYDTSNQHSGENQTFS